MNNLNNLVNQENGEIAIDFISEQLSNLTKYSKRLSGSDAEILLAIAESLDHMSTKYSKTLGNLDKFTYGTYQTLRNEGKTHLEAINFAEEYGFVDKEILRQFGRKYHGIENTPIIKFYVDTHVVVHADRREAQSSKIPEYRKSN